ncbi:MAG: hypothetical protein RRY06_07940, partial [Lachnospiraceae bacterium]
KMCRLNIPPEERNQPLNAENYQLLSEPYERACKTVENRLKQMDMNYIERNERSPYHSIESRIKTLESVKEKMQRKKIADTCMNAVNRIGDIAGIRVICFYIAEIYIIVEKIKDMKNVIVLKEKDYVTRPRGNGYRSYHLVIGAKIPGEEEDAYLPVEIQVRTIGMDWWASMEHQLCYKPSKNGQIHLSSELKRYSKQLYRIEQQMQIFYEPNERDERD